LFDKNGDSNENTILLDSAQTAENSTVKFYNDHVRKETLKFMAGKFSVNVKKEELVEAYC